MQIYSVEREVKQKRDGRLTLIFLPILLVICFNATNTIRLAHSISDHNNSEICASYDKRLYVTQDNCIGKEYKSIPITFYPLFFLPVPINTADKELLMTIKGIGPSTAANILTYRHQVSPILNIDDLKKIPGIGEKRANFLVTDLVFDRPE
jgi:competence ComEA-like helix-hairpin-helix protein